MRVSHLTSGVAVAYILEGQRWETPFEVHMVPGDDGGMQILFIPFNKFGSDISIKAIAPEHIVCTYALNKDLVQQYKDAAAQWAGRASGVIRPPSTEIVRP